MGIGIYKSTRTHASIRQCEHHPFLRDGFEVIRQPSDPNIRVLVRDVRRPIVIDQQPCVVEARPLEVRNLLPWTLRSAGLVDDGTPKVDTPTPIPLPIVTVSVEEGCPDTTAVRSLTGAGTSESVL